LQFNPDGLRCCPAFILPPAIENSRLHPDPGLSEPSKKLKKFFDDLKNTESTIGDYYFP